MDDIGSRFHSVRGDFKLEPPGEREPDPARMALYDLLAHVNVDARFPYYTYRHDSETESRRVRLDPEILEALVSLAEEWDYPDNDRHIALRSY